MSPKFLYLCMLLLLLVVVTQQQLNPAEALQQNAALENSLFPNLHRKPPISRAKRGAIWDFFQKIIVTKNLVADQFIDTKNTLNEVYNLVNEGFSDPAPSKPTVRPSSIEPTKASNESDEEMPTTTEKYTISRYELGRILGRNYRGLQRLAKIEFQDAFNQSTYNLQEYQAEARKQFANSLAVEQKKRLQKFNG